MGLRSHSERVVAQGGPSAGRSCGRDGLGGATRRDRPCDRSGGATVACVMRTGLGEPMYDRGGSGTLNGL
jgi:hypothetical protein